MTHFTQFLRMLVRREEPPSTSISVRRANAGGRALVRPRSARKQASFLLALTISVIGLLLTFAAPGASASATASTSVSSYSVQASHQLRDTSSDSMTLAIPMAAKHASDWTRSYGKCSQYGWSSSGGSLNAGPHVWAKICAPDIATKLFDKICEYGVSAAGMPGPVASVAGQLCSLAADWAAGHVLRNNGVWAEIYTNKVLAHQCLIGSHACSWNAGVW